MYKIVIFIHVVTSLISLIFAVLVGIRSFLGFLKKSIYSAANHRTELFFLIMMYFQLILGIILYFFLRPESNPRIKTIDDAYRFSSLRFWAIEHFSLMLFVLILVQIGYIFTSKLKSDSDKYRYAAIYFGISSVLILFSSGVYVYSKIFGN